MLEENAKNKLTKEQKRILKINKIYDVENYNRFNSWIKIFCKKYKIAGFLIYFFLN